MTGKRRHIYSKKSFWLLVLLALLCALLIRVSFTFDLRTTLAYFAHKTFPKIQLRLQSAHFQGLTGITLDGVEIWTHPREQQLLHIDQIRIHYRLRDLWAKRITKIEIENPNLFLSPEFVDAFTSSSKTKSASGSNESKSNGWTIDTFSCAYGAFVANGFKGMPPVSGRFTFDWKNFSFEGKENRRLTLWDFNIFLSHPERLQILNLYLVNMDFSMEGLRTKEIATAEFQGGLLIVGEGLRQLSSATQTREDSESTPDDPSSEGGWTLHSLVIRALETRIANLPANAPDIQFTFSTDLSDVSLQTATSTLGGREHEIELADFNVYSPKDATKKVISLRSVFIRFTINGLLRQEISQVRIIRPTIYVSEDLFWYMDQMQQETEDDAPSPDSSTHWRVGNLAVFFGKLVLAAGKSDQIGLPLNFETNVRDIDVGNLASLRLRAKLFVPEQNISLPDYRLQMERLSGDLRFAYPPDKGINNLVNVLHLDKVQWRQFQGRKLWMSVTFDLQGVHGAFGGEAYRGYLSGGFDFFFQPRSPWTGWVAGTDIDSKQVTDILAPQNFHMTAPLTFLIETNGRAKEIERLVGTFRATSQGRIRINKLDTFLEDIPPNWSKLKQSVTRIGLETLRDFDFDKAHGDFWFAGGRGEGNLRLSGPHGSRTLEAVLHP